MLNSKINDITREFFAANSKAIERYFDFAGQVIAVASDAAQPPCDDVLLRFLDDSADVITKYFEAHERALHAVKGAGPWALAHSAQSPDAASASLPIVFAQAGPIGPQPPSDAAGRAEKAPPSDSLATGQDIEHTLEKWLRDEIARMTGFPAEKLGVDARFDELGLDSLALAGLLESFLKHWPSAQSQAGELHGARSIREVMRLLQTATSGQAESQPIHDEAAIERAIFDLVAAVTGFDVNNIKAQTSFDDIGIDSLARARLLESLVTQFPEAAEHAQDFLATHCVGEAIALLMRVRGKKNGLNSGQPRHSSDVTPQAPADTATNAAGAPVAARLPALVALRERVVNALSQVYGVQITPITDETPFDDMGLDAFQLAALWRDTALKEHPYKLAGEELMVMRTLGDALNLLGGLQSRRVTEAG